MRVNSSNTLAGGGDRREDSISGSLPELPANSVYLSSKQNAVTTSVAVGWLFGRRHSDIMAAIRQLEISEDFRRLNFHLSSYTDRRNRRQPLVVMRRAGFARLVLSFTGKRAAALKEAFSIAFDQMEAQLSAPGPPPAPVPLADFTRRQVQVQCTKQAARQLLHSPAGKHGLIQHHRGVMQVMVGKTPTEYVKAAVASGLRVASCSGRELLRRLDPAKAAAAAFLDDQLQRGRPLSQLASAGIPEALTGAFAAMLRAGIVPQELQAA